jgi:hypothetical protein
MYGAGYPKPEYSYAARSIDPVFYFESGFGTATNFKAKVNPTDDGEGCRSTKRVAYMQRMDSYYRSADLPGPWTISAPANEPILIAGQWAHYSSSSYDYLSRSKIVYLGNICPWAAKVVTPMAGAKYKVQLSSPAPMVCTLTITSMDGSPVKIQDAPNCVKPRD